MSCNSGVAHGSLGLGYYGIFTCLVCIYFGLFPICKLTMTLTMIMLTMPMPMIMLTMIMIPGLLSINAAQMIKNVYKLYMKFINMFLML